MTIMHILSNLYSNIRFNSNRLSPFKTRRDNIQITNPMDPPHAAFNFIVSNNSRRKRKNILHTFFKKRQKQEYPEAKNTSLSKSILFFNKKPPRTKIRDATRLSMICEKKLRDCAIFSRNIYKNHFNQNKRSLRYKLDSLRRKPKIENSMSDIFKKSKYSDDVNLNISP